MSARIEDAGIMTPVPSVAIRERCEIIGLPQCLSYGAIKVRATNIFGTTGAVVNFTWHSDTTAPVAVLTETPPQLTGARVCCYRVSSVCL